MPHLHIAPASALTSFFAFNYSPAQAMLKRVTPLFLLLALLASAWCGVFAAAVCPHMKQGHTCCHARAASHPASHEGMADMQMGDSQGGATPKQEPEGAALGQPVELCDHCMGRSQLPALPATLREGEQSKRGADVNPTLPPLEFGTVIATFARTIPAREHAPPGAINSARYVLINVFRI